MSKNTRVGHVLAVLLATAATALADSGSAKTPRLIVQITVDQFRGDLPTRYRDRLGEGGFRYLLEHGVHYVNAHRAALSARPTGAGRRLMARRGPDRRRAL